MAVPFVDGFGRRVKYLRLSVTDRCDLRCRYCMSEAMTFLPSKELLTSKSSTGSPGASSLPGSKRSGSPAASRWCGRKFCTVPQPFPVSGQRHAAGVYADDQRHPAVALCGGTRRARCAPGQRVAGHARSGQIHDDHARRVAGPRPRRDRDGPSGRPRGQAQRGGAERPHRRRHRQSDRLCPCRRDDAHLDRNHAAGRDRR